jgi:catechol 2,3-dioxygenase-like lactoylglutathione lyase family enzyme
LLAPAEARESTSCEDQHMPYTFNHVHLKAPDPKKTADWYAEAFGFEILRDEQRPTGDRFLRCQTADGVIVNISAARTGENMGNGDATPHFGLEHFGVDVEDLEAEIERLGGMGARLLEGPRTNPATGLTVAFVQGPDDVRIELLQPAR